MTIWVSQYKFWISRISNLAKFSSYCGHYVKKKFKFNQAEWKANFWRKKSWDGGTLQNGNYWSAHLQAALFMFLEKIVPTFGVISVTDEVSKQVHSFHRRMNELRKNCFNSFHTDAEPYATPFTLHMSRITQLCTCCSLTKYHGSCKRSLQLR